MHHDLEIQSSQEDFDYMNASSCFPINPNEKFSLNNLEIIIDKAKFSLHEFINSLGNLKDQVLDLSNYKLVNDFKNINPYTTPNIILEIYDNIIRRIKINKKKKINWSLEDATLLIWIVEKYKTSRKKYSTEHFSEVDWNFIANMIPCKTPQQCMFKCFNLQKKNQNRNWTQVQDLILKELAEQNNNDHRWNDISKKLYQKNPGVKIYRNPKKCRERWECFVNPNIRKGPWTPQEDFNLLKYSFQIGKRWAQISKILVGRTQNAVKNRYQLLADRSKKKPYLNKFSSEDEFLMCYMNQLEINLMINIVQDDPMQIYLKPNENKKIIKKKNNKSQINKNIEQDPKQSYRSFMEYDDDSPFGQFSIMN